MSGRIISSGINIVISLLLAFRGITHLYNRVRNESKGIPKMKLMIIDDETSILKTMKKILEREGHECMVFENALEAVSAFPVVRPDAVITDIKMPVMNGLDVLREIKKSDPSAYIVILTGHADVESAISAVNGGAFAFFRKPPDIEELLNSLAQIEEMTKHPIPDKKIQIELHLKYEALRNELEKVKNSIEQLVMIHKRL